ncbi:MAG TPA: NUDIX hydrolase [Solirubrobacteraceae bacterium]|nr:NUDIX hydrolase [Solirubrobacteraceae bacterium]
MLPRPAATLILLREPDEVLMVQRNPALAFMGGFWVFPGGKVEDHDGSPEQAARRELTEEVALELGADAELIPFARWITPVGLPRRFDTWFFLARASSLLGTGDPTVDDSEIVAARWVRAADALTDGRPLAFPTRKNLERLAAHPDIDSLIAAARVTPIEPILPEIVTDDGRPAIVVPGSGEAPAHQPEPVTRAPELAD